MDISEKVSTFHSVENGWSALNDTKSGTWPDEILGVAAILGHEQRRQSRNNEKHMNYWMPQMVDLRTGRTTNHVQWTLGTILPSMDHISFQLNLKTCAPSLCHNMIHKAALHNLVFAWYPCHIPMFWLVSTITCWYMFCCLLSIKSHTVCWQ